MNCRKTLVWWYLRCPYIEYSIALIWVYCNETKIYILFLWNMDALQFTTHANDKSCSWFRWSLVRWRRNNEYQSNFDRERNWNSRLTLEWCRIAEFADSHETERTAKHCVWVRVLKLARVAIGSWKFVRDQTKTNISHAISRMFVSRNLQSWMINQKQLFQTIISGEVRLFCYFFSVLLITLRMLFYHKLG